MPPVLTNNLSVTVGGTLSIAGIGVASFRYGAQADNVEELEVATVDGDVHRCSRPENPELFWGVLSGPRPDRPSSSRRRCGCAARKPMTRTYYLLYDDARRFMEDARAGHGLGALGLHGVVVRSRARRDSSGWAACASRSHAGSFHST